MYVPRAYSRHAVRFVLYNDKRLLRLQDYLRERNVVLGLDLAACRDSTQQAVICALIEQNKALQIWMATNLPANRQEE